LTDEFRFDLQAKRTRLTDHDLLASLEATAERLGEGYFTSTAYDRQPGTRPHSSTIIERFGSWQKAMALIGISGGRARQYSPEDLVANLEGAWRELGFPPGKRQISSLAGKISEGPYRRHWGSLHEACAALAALHDGRISRDQLLVGRREASARKTVPLKDRWGVLKRDNYRCCKCGASPSTDHAVELEVDHIVPVAKGGTNDSENLQTLCQNCNQGKKHRQ